MSPRIGKPSIQYYHEPLFRLHQDQLKGDNKEDAVPDATFYAEQSIDSGSKAYADVAGMSTSPVRK